MAFLVANIPPIEVYVKKEYLYDHEKGHGDYEKGVWTTAKSITGRALYFETYLYNSGALFDKLPISAFCSRPVDKEESLPLEELQLWDCFSYHIAVIQKCNPGTGRCKYLSPSKQWHYGTYLFTIDSAHPDPNIPDVGYSEIPSQHKSFNILELDNGHYAAQPNNRVIFYDKSLSPKEMTFPDYKVSTIEYSVEQHSKWVAGDDESFFYELRDTTKS